MNKRFGGFLVGAMTLTVLLVSGCGGGGDGGSSTTGGSTNGGGTTTGGTTDGGTTTGGTTGGGTTSGVIRLPRTGQTVSYAAGDDGDLQKGVAWPAPRFNDIGDGTVADKLTGLIWAKDASTPTVNACIGGTKTWQSALDYVSCLNNTVYLGYSDWLLPNINELKSLIDVQNGVLTLPAGSPFTGVWRGDYWSSSTNAVNTGYAWVVASYDSAGGGEVPFRHKTWDYYVWPVRGGQLSSSTLSLPKTGQTISYASGDDGARQRGEPEPQPRFTVNGDGTVTDNRTGLIWLKNAYCFSSKAWSDALRSANTLANGSCGLSDGSVAGDWRLPNREELASLVDRGRSSPALPDTNPFNDVHYYPYYWTSSSYAYDTVSAWSVKMFDGVVGCYFKSSGSYVWPVRGG